jgi:superfamily II DNA helicase RecQ
MPLLSLIEDNFNFVKNLGIPSVSLSAYNKFDEKKAVNYLDEIKNLQYKLVYLTPEKVVNSSSLTTTL